MASCHGCSDSFGFWKKNVGCPKCGFSYCQKCIRFKIDSKTAGKDQTLVVCQKCYLAAQTPLPSANRNVATEGTIQQEDMGKAMEVLEMLDDPGKPPITLYRESNRVANLKRGLSIQDQKIVDRLEELRGGTNRRRKSEQESEDVAERLAKLKGVPYDASIGASSSCIPFTTKPESEEELLFRLADQVNLESKHDFSVVEDITQRLHKLRGVGQSSSKEGNSSGSASDKNSPAKGIAVGAEEKTEEEEIEEIMKRYVAECALPQSLKPKESHSEDEGEVVEIDSGSESDDYDHCCRICEEKRATLMCKECDDDIFCYKCFKEFHDELGESHNPTPIGRRSKS